MHADRIEQEIVIAAPVERVWAVLSEPEHVGRWFGHGKPAHAHPGEEATGETSTLVEFTLTPQRTAPGCDWWRAASRRLRSRRTGRRPLRTRATRAGWTDILGDVARHAERLAA